MSSGDIKKRSVYNKLSYITPQAMNFVVSQKISENNKLKIIAKAKEFARINGRRVYLKDVYSAIHFLKQKGELI